MLLEHDLPVIESDAARAARVWRHREGVEREAAALFETLGVELAAFGYCELAVRAATAAKDERRHAARCRAIVEALTGTTVWTAEPPRRLVLGLAALTHRDRVLYAAVAVGCITESLSCALLLELRELTTHPIVTETVAEILRDEIEHARIGWAVLAAEAAARDVGWLATHLTAMRRAAVAEDVTPMTGEPALAGLGVLPRTRVRELVETTWASVIEPGMSRYGIRA